MHSSSMADQVESKEVMAVKSHNTDRDIQSVARGSVAEESHDKAPEDIDDAVLRANGHKSELQRQFNWLSGLGLGFSITNSWIGYLSCFGQSLIYGGPQVVILGLVVAWAVQFMITLGLSEIASAFPSAGGQYHFCYILGPQKAKRVSAFVVGWLSVLAWWIVSCSGISLATVTLAGVINFFEPTFEVKSWQIYLFYVAISALTAVPVFVASKRLSIVVQVSLWLSVIGMLVTLFVTTGMHSHTNPPEFLVSPGLGTSGWNAGTAWVLGIANCMYAFGATDGAIHISEEISQPGRRVPQVMMTTMFVGLATSLPLFIALMFFMTDLEAVLASPLPSMELIYQATGSKPVTLFLVSWLLIVYVLALPSQWVTCGRLAWAFARDNGVPYSQFFSKVSSRFGFPVRTTLAAGVFIIIYGLLYLASTTAFNSIITSAVLFPNITYAAPQLLLLIKGRKSGLPPRYLRLGWFGYVCNIFSVLWIVVLIVIVCMPPALPVETASMNYVSVIVVGLLLIICILWFTTGRKNFEGPHIDWEMLKDANAISLTKETKEVAAP